jgi:hypothetical protein
VKITSYKKCLASEELGDKIGYKRNKVLGEKEVRRRHRAS